MRSRHVHAAGERFHVLEAGDGAPCVLVHGIGVASRYLLPLARELAARRRVLVPELPGWGASSRPRGVPGISALGDYLAALLEAERFEGVPLVANSLGCQIVVDLGARRPELVDSLVLVGPTIDPAYRSWLRHTTRLLVDCAREPPSLIAIIARDYIVFGPRRFVATARAALRDRLEAKLPMLRQPLLVIRGERDGFVTQAWAERVAELGTGRLAAVPGAAHAAHYSHPRVVARLVEEFHDRGR